MSAQTSDWTQSGAVVCFRSCLTCGSENSQHDFNAGDRCAAIVGRALTACAMRSAMRTGPAARPAVRNPGGQACASSTNMRSSSAMSSSIVSVLRCSSCCCNADATTQQLSKGLVELRSGTRACSPRAESFSTIPSRSAVTTSVCLKNILNGREDALNSLKVESSTRNPTAATARSESFFPALALARRVMRLAGSPAKSLT